MRYAAQGYRVRPYGDFDIWGKIKKGDDSDRRLNGVLQPSNAPGPLVARTGLAAWAGPSRLHFIKLDANYEQYWINDSDACVSVSYHEVLLWFNSRGDQCVNCLSEWNLAFGDDSYNSSMFIRVMKN